MKKILLLLAILPIITLSSCSKDDAIVVNSVKLDKSTLSLQIENTHQFVVSYLPSDAPKPICKWESSNNDIVTIDNQGIATAISVGTATITGIANDNLRSTCEVTVTPIDVASITLNKNSMELLIGGEETLTYTIAPENSTNKDVEWSSSDNAIATVDATGKVTAIGVGNAQITVKTNNDISDICEITIDPIALEGITLDQSLLELEITDEETLIVNFAPLDATNKTITWTSSDNSIATVSENGIVTGIIEGNAVITAKSEDGGFTATCNVKVKLNGITLTKNEIQTIPNRSELIHVKYSTSGEAYVNATWSSSDPNVATVTGDGIGTNSALIETKNTGTAIITATSADGKKTASCTIQVKTVTDIVKISANVQNLSIGSNGSITLHSRIVYPSNLDIVVISAILLDENRYMVSIVYNSDYCKFPTIPISGSWGSDQFNLYNRWIVHYQFEFEGKTYKVEENIDSQTIGSV